MPYMSVALFPKTSQLGFLSIRHPGRVRIPYADDQKVVSLVRWSSPVPPTGLRRLSPRTVSRRAALEAGPNDTCGDGRRHCKLEVHLDNAPSERPHEVGDWTHLIGGKHQFTRGNARWTKGSKQLPGSRHRAM